MGYRIMVVGSGAREHALIWKLAQSPSTDALACASGNGGTAALATNLDAGVADLAGLERAAREWRADLVIVGPEQPLSLGLADYLTAAGIPVVGPTAAASRIESSKAWAKLVMEQAGVPTARSLATSDIATARAALPSFGLPVVIKADGLAAGKGVVVATTVEEAEQALAAFLEQRVLGAAADTILLEEYLTGTEVSLLALTDGLTVRPLQPACDYKRANDGDVGPNTGGMGAYSPVPFVSTGMVQNIVDNVLQPTVQQMAALGSPMRGVLYAGLMMTAEGPRVLEFNARFGDPETQVVLPLLETDLVSLMMAVASGDLERAEPLVWRDEVAVGVVLASGGYPEAYSTGYPISGVEDVGDALVFHAGTALQNDGSLFTAGGRVLTVVGLGSGFEEARQAAYSGAEAITFNRKAFRSDIAVREVAPGSR